MIYKEVRVKLKIDHQQTREAMTRPKMAQLSESKPLRAPEKVWVSRRRLTKAVPSSVVCKILLLVLVRCHSRLR
jgi:hypothetical protein